METPTNLMYEEVRPKMVTLLPEYSNVHVSYNSFRIFLILLGVILVVLILVLFFVGYYYSMSSQTLSYDKYAAVKHLVGSDAVQSNIKNFLGQSDNGVLDNVSNAKDFLDKRMCENAENTVWDPASGCKCKPPYWGRSCQREVHGNNYVDIGTLKSFYCKLDVLSKHKVDNKAFTSDKLSDGILTCEQRCDSHEKCVGYVYNDKYPNYNCILLGTEPAAEISYDSNVDGDLYLHKSRSKNRPNLGHTVILYTNPLPPRFWIKDPSNSEGLADIGFNHINRISFYPDGLINDANANIVFSKTHFNLSAAKKTLELYQQSGKVSKDFYVYTPGNKFSLPQSIVKGGYWVMALGEPITCYRHDQTEDFSVTDPRGENSETLDMECLRNSKISKRETEQDSESREYDLSQSQSIYPNFENSSHKVSSRQVSSRQVSSHQVSSRQVSSPGIRRKKQFPKKDFGRNFEEESRDEIVSSGFFD